jgi:hypothetical protein
LEEAINTLNLGARLINLYNLQLALLSMYSFDPVVRTLENGKAAYDRFVTLAKISDIFYCLAHWPLFEQLLSQLGYGIIWLVRFIRQMNVTINANCYSWRIHPYL